MATFGAAAGLERTVVVVVGTTVVGTTVRLGWGGGWGGGLGGGLGGGGGGGGGAGGAARGGCFGFLAALSLARSDGVA